MTPVRRRIPLKPIVLRPAVKRGKANVRDRGTPTSSNGASSMHLAWTIDNPVRTVRAILEIPAVPKVDALYFWALQATFRNADGSGFHGGAHLGLQWHPGHPGKTAVNWGGYNAQGIELAGTASALPSATNNPNTRDYTWKPRRRYELVIKPSSGGWAGVITDLATRQATTIRTLHAGGARLTDIAVWTECFAACDAPSVSARWSGLEAAGRPAEIVTATYQTYADGGCTNTNQSKSATTITQATKTRRTNDHGKVFRLPKPPAPKARR